MALSFQIPYWYDLHTHLRQDEILPIVIHSHIKAKCAGLLAMPNTVPPVAKLFKSDDDDYMSIEEYQELILEHTKDKIEHLITPLYLTKDTTPELIIKGATTGILKACKFYPPFGTTNADHGREVDFFIENGVFREMEKQGVILCIHGEESKLSTQEYFDKNKNAEEIFYKNNMVKLHRLFPNLKIVCEHLTTEVAVEFVKGANNNVAATITPQHLLYTIADLVKGFKYHLYCLPLLKFENDREALRLAATSRNNTKFFAGTDSAPHFHKVTECGCAAGCFTAEVAPQMYLEAFEMAGLNMEDKQAQEIFENFLCTNGANFYSLPISKKQFTVTKRSSSVDIIKYKDGTLVPLPVGLNNNHKSSPTTLSWSID
jgi:dihydroorotase